MAGFGGEWPFRGYLRAVTGAVIAVGASCEAAAGRRGSKETAKKQDRALGKGSLPEVQPDPQPLQGQVRLHCCRDLTSKWHDAWLCRDHALHCRRSSPMRRNRRELVARTGTRFPPCLRRKVENLKDRGGQTNKVT